MFTEPTQRTRPAPFHSGRFRRRLGAASLATGMMVFTACGGDAAADESASDVASLDEVASLDASAAVVEADSGSTLDADEAALAFSQCLRDEGLDVPDIGVDADGNINLRGAFEGLGPGDESFADAMDSCSDILGDTQFGGGRGAGGLADNTALQDAMVELTACVREEGFPEATELTFGQPAAAGDGEGPDATGDGRPEQRGQGEGGGPGEIDNGSRFATQMGLDAEDPDVIAAMEVCTPILDEAFGDTGFGGAGRAEG